MASHGWRSRRLAPVAVLRAGLVLLATHASGCLLTQDVHYERGGVDARGKRPALGRSSFHEVMIGRPGRPWDGSPAFTLVLPDGQQVASAELTPALVRSLPGKRTVNPYWYLMGEWPDRVEEILLEPYDFVLLDDRVVAIGVCAWFREHEDPRLAREWSG